VSDAPFDARSDLETPPARPATDLRHYRLGAWSHGSGWWSARSVGFGLRCATWPWVLSRLVVLGALALGHELAAEAGLGAPARARLHQGLLGWDAAWYRTIAAHGYAAVGVQGTRFFPLVPLLARVAARVLGFSAGAALLGLANLGALVAGVLVAIVVRRELEDDAAARRAAWLLLLAPPAFTFVMGYAEAPFVALVLGTFLALRTGRFVAAGVLGALAGLARPLGVLLAVPAAIEALRAACCEATRTESGGAPADGVRPGIPRSVRSPRVVRAVMAARGAVAVLGPPMASGAYVLWAGARFHDFLAPLRVEQQPRHRGGLADPFVTLAHDARLLVQGHHLGTALHLPWVLLAVGLAVVAARRLPASYAAFAGCVLAVVLVASNLDSFERYALSAVPLVIAAAAWLRRPLAERAVLVLTGAGLAGYALLAFVSLYVP
jgi:hypothetical protein